MGGRGGSSGISGGGSANEEITSTIGKYTIKGNSVSAGGRSFDIISYEELSGSEKAKYEQYGIKNPVRANGRVYLPKEIADKAIQQGKAQEEAIKTNMKNNVKGYDKLKSALDANDASIDSLTKSIDRGDSRYSPKPLIKTSAIAKEYPRAAMYIKAESYSYASNYKKAYAGEEAMKAIRRGKSLSYAKKILDDWNK